MKKLLLGISLLGSLTYGAEEKLYISVSANMLNTTSNNILIIEPTVSASKDETYILFDFGNMSPNSINTLTGRFRAIVIENTPSRDVVPLEEAKTENDSGFYVTLKVNNSFYQKGHEGDSLEVISASNNNSPTTLSCLLTNNSGVRNGIYEGEIVSKIVTGTTPGSFSRDYGEIVVKVKMP